jgi:hypothetical protein
MRGSAQRSCMAVSIARNKRGQLAVSKFRAIGRQLWQSGEPFPSSILPWSPLKQEAALVAAD